MSSLLSSMPESFVNSSFVKVCGPNENPTEKRQESSNGYGESLGYDIQHFHSFSNPP